MLRWLRRWRPEPGPEAQLAQARSLSLSGHPADAARIWLRLAEAGVPRAQTNLGACYATGAGLAADPEQARLWLQRGAEAGDSLGQRNLGTMLLRAAPAEAATWYRRAAEQGDAISQNELSRMLFEGEGVARDLSAARHLAEQAAAQGIAAAAHRLGMMHHDASGVPRDPAQAARWWRQAAEAGEGDAAAMLGAAYLMGQGVVADGVEALAWLLVGSARQSTLVRPFLGRARDALLPERQAAAERRARLLGWTG